MKKIFQRLSILALGVLCCGACLGGGFAYAHTQAATLSDVEVQETYTIGQTVNVPDATITVGGTAYETTKTLVYPNGSTTAVDLAVLRMSGEHEIVYKAIVDGKLYEESVSFVVLNDRYSVSSEKSVVAYGTNDYTGDMEGLNLSLVAGDTFTYNRVIDLNTTQGQELIRFYYVPKEFGEGDVNQTYIQLTDVYDPENYVRVQYNSRIRDIGSAWDRVYISAGANGQDLKGLEYSSRGGFEYNGNKYAVHTNDFFGLSSQTSWTGELNTKYHSTFADNYNYLKFDYAARKLYARPPKSYQSRNMITDLDEPRLYGDNLWKGFTTGEVIMTLYCENYASTAANFFISDIIDGELSEEPFKDEVAPDIILDMQGYAETDIPKANQNKPYRVFDAIAYDNLEGVKSVDVKAYYNYYGAGKSLVQIENGAFVPKRTGSYTIVYTANDSLGNITVKTLDVVCEARTEDLGVVFGGYADSCAVMSKVSVAKYGVVNANGFFDVKINAILKSDPTVNVEIDVNERTFTPTHTGTYEIVYTVCDYTDTATAKYELEVQTVELPVFSGAPTLPKYLIKGCTYTFETPKAYDYSTATSTALNVETYLKEDLSSSETKINGAYTVAANEKVVLVYKATNANGVASVEYVVPVVDVKYGEMGNIQLKNYFQGDGFTSSVDETKATYVKEYDGTTTADLNFINAVSVNEYTFAFSLAEELCNFSSLDLILENRENVAETLKITFFQESDKLNFYVNGYSVKTFSFYYQVGEEVEVYYNRSENLVIVNSDYSINLNSEKGVFSGFSGNLANMTIRFNGVGGNVGLHISKLLKQLFVSDSLDFGTPAILAKEKEITTGNYGETVIIRQRDYFDLLDPQIRIEFSVYDPNDEVVIAKDGTELYNADPYRDYEIELQEYGSYYIQYKATDFSGNVARFAYQINVRDFVPPTAELSGKYVTACSVGDEVEIAKVVATDNNGEAKWYAVVVKPNGDVEMIVNNVFQANVKGQYKVYYTLFDKNNNASQIYYVVTAY